MDEQNNRPENNPNDNPQDNGNGHEGGDQVLKDNDRVERIVGHPPTPHGFASQEPVRYILMSPHMILIGSLIAFLTGILIVVMLPYTTFNPPASYNWLPLSDAGHKGRAIYIANGCVYCHSQFSRPEDTFAGFYYTYPRTSEPGDYRTVRESPNLFGTERTGPDLQNEGGMHPSEWHTAHYWNARSVHPLSIMPIFSFFSQDDLSNLQEYNQESGGKEAILRWSAQEVGFAMMQLSTQQGTTDPADLFPDLVKQLTATGEYKADGAGTDLSPSGLAWSDVWLLNTMERSYWLTADPLAVTQQNLMRGKAVFLTHCQGCHGANGGGLGPAAASFTIQPFDFTNASNQGPGMGGGPFTSDGQLYHRILTGGKGTPMENFGTRLSVEDIWRVVLFLRTIQYGSLVPVNLVPTPDNYRKWTPPPELMNYISTHPIEAGPRNIGAPPEDPFMAAANWVAPGLGPTDTVLVNGQLPITQARLIDLIRAQYFQHVNQMYNDALKAVGSDLPPKEEIMDTSHIVFHIPS